MSMNTKTLLTALAAAVLTATPATADTLELTGTLRDFKRGDWTGGHPDFQTATMSGRGGHGLVHGHVTMEISEDGKPVYSATRPSKDNILSAESFHAWYRDVPDVNVSVPLTLTLDNGQEEPGGIYTIAYSGDNQFFPLDGQAFGNEGLSHNYHFTFELHTVFTYQPGQLFNFLGDDDVWVYINGVRVIDIGGTHSAVSAKTLLFDGKAFVLRDHFNNATTSGWVHTMSSSMVDDLQAKWDAQSVEGDFPLNAEDWAYIDLQLTEGQECTLDFFFAERHTTQSNFRIDTTINLVEVEPTTVSPLYD